MDVNMMAAGSAREPKTEALGQSANVLESRIRRRGKQLLEKLAVLHDNIAFLRRKSTYPALPLSAASFSLSGPETLGSAILSPIFWAFLMVSAAADLRPAAICFSAS